MGATCTIMDMNKFLKFFSETAKKIAYGPLKNSGERYRTILALLLCVLLFMIFHWNP